MEYFSGINGIPFTFNVMMGICLVGILVLIVGLLLDIRKWGQGSVGYGIEPAPGKKGFIGTYFKQLFHGEGHQGLIATIILDIILLRRTFRADWVRWIMHMCIFYGWMGLFSLSGLMFAGEMIHKFGLLHFDIELFRAMLQFPNQILGYILLAGIFIAVARRLFNPVVRKSTNSYDTVMIATLVIVVVTGFIAHAGRFIIVPNVYDVEFVVPVLNWTLSEAMLLDIHDYMFWTLGGLHFFYDYVMEFALLHSILAMFVGFAFIPYSKYIHAVATPLTLLVNRGGEH